MYYIRLLSIEPVLTILKTVQTSLGLYCSHDAMEFCTVARKSTYYRVINRKGTKVLELVTVGFMDGKCQDDKGSHQIS